MQQAAAFTAPEALLIGEPYQVLGIAHDAPWPAPFLAAAEHLAGLWKCSEEEALECLDFGTLYAAPLEEAAKYSLTGCLSDDEAERLSPYLDFDRYGRECLMGGRLVAFRWQGREFIAEPVNRRCPQPSTNSDIYLFSQ